MVKAMLAKSVSKEKHSVSVIRTNTVCDCVKYSTGNALKHSLSENNLIKTNILYPTRNKQKHLKKREIYDGDYHATESRQTETLLSSRNNRKV